VLFTLLGAFAAGPWSLVATRFIAGIGIGAEPPLVDAYLSEMLPSRDRGRYTALAYTVGFLGVPAVGLLARVLVPRTPFGIDGWRWLFVAGSLGGAIIWRLRARLPESPRWLESVGRVEEADAITGALESEAAQAGALPTPADTERPQTGIARLSSLFSPEHRRRTAVLFVFHIFQTIGYYGFGTLVPLVLAAKGFTIVSSLQYTSIVFFGYPLGSALSMPLVERVDRRWLIVASALLMAVCGLSLGAATSPPAIIGFGLAYTLVSNVFSNAFHIFQAEIFPTYVRATAAGTAYGLSRLSSATMPFVLLPVLERDGAGAMFAVVALAMLVVIVDIGLFAPRTTGRALEGI
jgi:putative MFS transporter